jgi:hypothetical protein
VYVHYEETALRVIAMSLLLPSLIVIVVVVDDDGKKHCSFPCVYNGLSISGRLVVQGLFEHSHDG